MGLLGKQTVLAKCPACQATTKVNAHPEGVGQRQAQRVGQQGPHHAAVRHHHDHRSGGRGRRQQLVQKRHGPRLELPVGFAARRGRWSRP